MVTALAVQSPGLHPIDSFQNLPFLSPRHVEALSALQILSASLGPQGSVLHTFDAMSMLTLCFVSDICHYFWPGLGDVTPHNAEPCLQVLCCGASYDASMRVEATPVVVSAFEGHPVVKVCSNSCHSITTYFAGGMWCISRHCAAT